MDNKHLNRIKVVLAEKEENQQMVGRAIRQRPGHNFQMGNKYYTAQFGNDITNCKSAGG